MFDFSDKDVWLALIGLTILLYGIKWLLNSKRQKIYRVSPDVLRQAKEVVLKVLPLVEDGQESPLSEYGLPYSRENVKSAVKILAYYFWRENLKEELERMKNCYISLSRFQNPDLEDNLTAKLVAREKERLTNEFEDYTTHSPFR